MARVFVPQEPVKKGRDGEWIRQFDLSSAAEYGELIFVCPPSKPSLDPESSMPSIRVAMDDFGPDDYLLPVGSMRLIVWCTALASIKVDKLKVLEWDSGARRYVATTADVRCLTEITEP